MKYSLDCYIKTNNEGIRNAIKQILPSIDDARVWAAQYEFNEAEDPFDAIMIFSCSIRFHLKSDRDGFTNSVKGLAGIIQTCENGSFVREHKCYHDEIPSLACEEETILRKD
jgi:hypothetical protein